MIDELPGRTPGRTTRTDAPSSAFLFDRAVQTYGDAAFGHHAPTVPWIMGTRQEQLREAPPPGGSGGSGAASTKYAICIGSSE